MTRQNNKEYYVCSCGAWVYADKVKKGTVTHCQQCWKPWPKNRTDNKQQGQQNPWRQSPARQQQQPQNTSPKQSRPRPRRVKGTEVWKEHWEALPAAVQEELKRQGVDPHAQKEQDVEDPLLQMLQEHKEQLPLKLQLELAKREPPAPTAKEQGAECSKKLSQATSRLKGLVRKQLGLQETINETKEALRILLQDMQNTTSEILESQKQVEEAKKELSAVVGEPGAPAPGPDSMDIEAVLGKIGVTLNDEQQQALQEQLEMSKKRRLGPSLSQQGPTQAGTEPEHPPGLTARPSPGPADPNQDTDKDGRHRSRSPKNVAVPSKADEQL